MSLERLREIVARFRDLLGRAPGVGPVWSGGTELGRDLLESMLLARHLDVAAHELRAKGHGHYTIASSGHESNVVLGRLTRTTDPTLVHYRSAAFFVERARQVPGTDPVRDIALGLVASSEEPTSGGRHKVFGSRPLGIIPQTSTIASHLPRALGLAFALELKPRLGLTTLPPKDAIAVASFGDASVNHSTALGAFNAASWTVHQNLKLPLLLVCEDNGLGISVRSPPGWVEARLQSLPGVKYFAASGEDLGATFEAARQAVEYCRLSRKPAVLHLRCVRLLGHAGSDVDTSYRTSAELAEVIARDPVTEFALSLVRSGAAADQLLALDESADARVRSASEHAVSRPKLEHRADVLSAVALPLTSGGTQLSLPSATGGSIPTKTDSKKDEPRLTLAQGINRALSDILEHRPEAVLFGEDVAKKGGVYGLTKGLYERFGPTRIFNTLLDEQTILGLALGAATLGLLPIPEIQYLAYLHNAEDQLRGEASTMRFFSAGTYDNPLILRIAGLAYQKGFGGHFHNDHSLAVLRDIPGIVVAVPARAGDAFALYRQAVHLALERRRVVVIVEPIALYHLRDLHAEGDGAWLENESDSPEGVLRTRIYRPDARDVLIVTYGNGVMLSLRAAKQLEAAGIACKVMDLRWLAPLPTEELLEHAREARRILVVDECRKSGNVGEAIVAEIAEAHLNRPLARVAAADSFVPLGDAADLVLVSEAEIVSAARRLCES